MILLPKKYESNPDVIRTLGEFTLKYQNKLQNPILRTFFEEDKNVMLLINALCFPNNENRKKIDVSFKEHYTEIRLIHYISKMIDHYSRDFRRKRINDQNRLLCILDQPITSGSGMTYGEIICSEEIDLSSDLANIISDNSKSLEDHIGDTKLLNAFKSLDKKQQVILQLYFINQLTHKQIGYMLGVSQQAVSKSYRKAIKKLYLLCRGGDQNG